MLRLSYLYVLILRYFLYMRFTVKCIPKGEQLKWHVAIVSTLMTESIDEVASFLSPFFQKINPGSCILATVAHIHTTLVSTLSGNLILLEEILLAMAY